MKALDPYAIDLEKTTLIEASAGTGKTYTITTLYCRLVAKGFSVESILVVTFTEAAAAELKLRIRKRLSSALKRIEEYVLCPDTNHPPDDELVLFLCQDKDIKIISKRFALAISSFDQASILTIHSFCLKILKENAFESRYLFDMKLMPDRSVFFNQVSYDFFMSRMNHLDPLMLKFFDRRNITPDSFITSFSPVVSRKKIIIKPEAIPFNHFFDEYRQVVAQIKTLIDTQSTEICDLFATCEGINKRTYSKKNVPNWLEAARIKFEAQETDAFFDMNEKGDSLYKFTVTRIESAQSIVPPHTMFELCERLLYLSRNFEDNLIALKQEFLTFFNASLEKIKIEQGICFFDDLVNDLFEALKNDTQHPLYTAVRSVYKACLIDEFQDTDTTQYDIFSRLFASEKTPFFMIGDPKQAIYAFRGGDIFAYLAASKDSAQQFTLLKNYRSAPLLIQGINQIFSLSDNPFLFDPIVFSPVSTPQSAVNRLVSNGQAIAPLQFEFVRRDHENTGTDGYIPLQTAQGLIPDITARKIAALLGSDQRLVQADNPCGWKITPEDIAVLVRTNKQAQQIYEALLKYEIPAYISKSGSVYESPQAMDLLDILTAVYHPEDKGYLKAALCSGVYNFTAGQLSELDLNESMFYAWQERFACYHTLWEEKGFVRMIMEVLHSDRSFLISGTAIHERKLTNFYHLVELISNVCIKQELSPFYLMKWYVRQLNAQFRDDHESADELRLETDKKAVGIITVHKSKGLEFPIVYLPYMWEGQKSKTQDNIIFHDPENHYGLTLDLGSTDSESAIRYFETETQAENRRLLYVALTRASAMCSIIWCPVKNIQMSALARMLHPDGCSEDESMICDIEDLKSRCPESISCHFSEDAVFEPKIGIQDQLLPALTEPEPVIRNMNAQWRISSFSGLTKSSHPEIGISLSENTQSDAGLKITLADFPKGPRAGDLFHAIFETMDFTKPADKNQADIQAVFDTFGYTDPHLLQTGVAAINQVLETQLVSNETSFCLNQIQIHERLTEMEFVFNVRSFNISWIKTALELSHPEWGEPGYTDALSQLNLSDFTGFLKGFIDLVICH
ncbi:MAG: UvrD-helicase domain-containing protein, partial [Proteobacteria bacterium]|nr:UvrD-helicase domain-containing protein [Pseudomonadota bacterium]